MPDQPTSRPIPYRVIRSAALVALALILQACGIPVGVDPSPSPLERLVGVYELVSYAGRPLPTREFRAVYHAGRICLGADRRYTSELDAEACYPGGSCTRSTSRSEGTWLLLHDGTLYFDSQEGYGWPPPRIEADGQELRFYIPGDWMLGFTFRRQ